MSYLLWTTVYVLKGSCIALLLDNCHCIYVLQLIVIKDDLIIIPATVENYGDPWPHKIRQGNVSGLGEIYTERSFGD